MPVMGGVEGWECISILTMMEVVAGREVRIEGAAAGLAETLLTVSLF